MHTGVARDPAKAGENLAKHAVNFSDAEGVLYDPLALTREDELSEGERGFVALGMDFLGRLLVIVFSHREDCIRLISARRATSRETKSYETGI